MDQEIDTLARTIYGEARGQGNEGMLAVACVVANRVKIALAYKERLHKNHPLYGDGTFQGACLQPKQFSCWNKNDRNRPKLIAVDSTNPTFRDCVNIATRVISGEYIDNTCGATHYYERHIPVPYWAKGEEPIARIGDHIFFKLG